MVRPRRGRRIEHNPNVTFFKPAGVPAAILRICRIDLDELEAMRLVDGEGLHQTQAAERMGISQSTIARLLASGRKKVVQGLVQGEALEIQQSNVPHYMPMNTPPPPAPAPRRRQGRGTTWSRAWPWWISIKISHVPKK